MNRRQQPDHALRKASRRARRTRRKLELFEPLWPAEATVLLAIALGLLLPDQLMVGNRWLIPACEAALLIGLILTSPRPPTRESEQRRLLRIALVGLVSAGNIVALFLLTRSLVDGNSSASGRALLLGASVLWLTAVLLFAVWFWELDRGGPVRRLTLSDESARTDFLFPQMTEDVAAPEDWRPRMVDYLYLSVNNAASFSPSETIPLTVQAKVLLMAQTFASLTTTTLVVSYAINNLR
jgi:hypothetical protein